MILAQYKVHHFFPQAQDLQFEFVKSEGVYFTKSPEYKSAILNKNTRSFKFPDSHFPQRINDIFVENTKTHMLMPNRVVYQPQDSELLTIKVVAKGLYSDKSTISGIYTTEDTLLQQCQGDYLSLIHI